jgi:hypothetical protein
MVKMDKVIVTGSSDLMRQFKDFILRHIEGSVVKLKRDKKYYRLYVYSYTARMLLELIQDVDRKLAQARLMSS